MFRVFVEHKVIDGTVETEEFDGVEQILNPPMNEKIVLRFSGERDDVSLNYGYVAMVTDKPDNE